MDKGGKRLRKHAGCIKRILGLGLLHRVSKPTTKFLTYRGSNL